MEKGCRRAGAGRATLHHDGYGMSERLGHLVYWIACLIAIAAICLAIYAATESTGSGWYTVGILAGGGILIWIVGRAVRHALAPPKASEKRPRLGHDG
jgi:hypothetical protein